MSSSRIINSTLLAELVCTPQYSSYHSVSYVNDITLLGGWNNYVRQAQYHTAVSNYGMMYNQNNLIPTNTYTASRDWDLRPGDWLRNTFDSHSEEGEQQRIGPYAKGAVLLIPSVSLTNSGKTLITGRDLYGNKAEAMDYGLSIIDFATFGASTCNLPKHIAKNNLGIDLGATGYSIFRTIQNEKKKQ